MYDCLAVSSEENRDACAMNFSRLIWAEPWLAPLVLNLRNVIATEAVETAAVTPDGETLYYNPVFWKGLMQKEQLGLQLHEILHIAHCHMARKAHREMKRWNIACDMAINYQLTASGYTLPQGALEGKDDTAENIYEFLLSKKMEGEMEKKKETAMYVNRNVRCDGRKIPCSEEPDDEMDDNAFEKGDDLPTNDDCLQSDLCIQGVHYGDLLPCNLDGSISSSRVTMEAVESVKRLAEVFAGRGTSPLAAAFQVLPARVDWRLVLNRMVKSVVGDDVDFLSYEFDEFGVCEDVLSPKPRTKICVLVDESGSISDELYGQFLGELEKMARFAEVYVSGFTDNSALNALPLKKYHRSMTGGTDVRVPYKEACKKDFDCIIVLTDGYLPFPDYELKPTIWAMPESFDRKMEVLL